MKKFFTYILLIIIIFLAPNNAQASSNYISGYTSTTLNVRSKPNGPIVGKIDPAEKITGFQNNGWIKLPSGNYICNLGIVQGKQVSGYTLQALNVRKSPGGKILSVLNKFSYVKGVKIDNYILTDKGPFKTRS